MPGKRAAKSTEQAKTKAGKIVFDQHKEVRAIARERVGIVKPAQTILPKTDRKKPKHKKPVSAELEAMDSE